MFCEDCWFLQGVELGPFYIGRLKFHSSGSGVNVDFSWSEAVSKNLLGFYHSHGAGDPYISGEDESTMKCWVRSEGRPMLCGVVSGPKQRCWVFYRKKGVIRYCPIKSIIVGSLFIGRRIKKVRRTK